MFRQHIDFIAVFFIAVALLAYPQLYSLRVRAFRESIQLYKAPVNIQSCPTAWEDFAHVFSNLNY